MTNPLEPWTTASEIAASIQSGEITAVEVTQSILTRIKQQNHAINAYTDVLPERALSKAAEIDTDKANGKQLGPLAGVPFAVKNLFDIKGIPTRAGSKINRELPPATQDAKLIKRLEIAGAILVGALNMGEYAYDFTGNNAHDGQCKNPHNLDHISGGSSSGCGAATAAGLAPLSLGSDTNGSIRVPSSMCGIFGLKPTYGRLTRAGTFPFVDSLDHLGPFARSPKDLAIAYDIMQGPDKNDHACIGHIDKTLPSLEKGIKGLKIGIIKGWIEEHSGEEANKAIETVSTALKEHAEVSSIEINGIPEGRAAAYLITNSESSAFHMERIHTRIHDFDPEVQCRFLSGALLPANWIILADRARKWWLDQMMNVFKNYDLLIAPATPSVAPAIGQDTMVLAGKSVPTRPNIGVLTQPFSCIGLPIVAAPVFNEGELPIAIQLIAPPWREDLCLQAAYTLEQLEISKAHKPTAFDISE